MTHLKINNPTTTDGELNDATKQNSPLKKKFIPYNPIYGEDLPAKSIMWLAYDEENLYLAFNCYDKEPAKIKTSITQRDRMFSDDWVGLFRRNG